MRAQTFIILLVVTVLGVAAAAAAVLTRPGDAVYANLGDPVVPGLIDRVNDVAKVRVESDEGGVLTIERQADGKGWSVIERNGYPAKADLVHSLAVRVAQLTYLAPKTKKPDLYERLELQDPSVKGSHSRAVKLFDAKGDVMADLVIGTARAVMEGSTQGGAYFRLPGDDQAWVGRGSMEVNNLIFDWIERKLFDIETKRIKRVVVTHPDGEKVEIFKDQAGDANFILADVPGDRKIKNEFAVNGVASTIGDFQVQDVFKRGKHTVDPAKTVTLVYETFDGLVITARLEEQTIKTADGEDEEFHLADISLSGDPKDAEEFAVYESRTKGWVYEISDFRFDSFAKRLKDLTDPVSGS